MPNTTELNRQTGQRHVTRQEVWGGNKEPVRGSNENLGLLFRQNHLSSMFLLLSSVCLWLIDSLTQCTVSSLFLLKSISVPRTDPSFTRSSSHIPYSPSFSVLRYNNKHENEVSMIIRVMFTLDHTIFLCILYSLFIQICSLCSQWLLFEYRFTFDDREEEQAI